MLRQRTEGMCNMLKIKRFFTMALAALLTAGLMTGCSSGGESNAPTENEGTNTTDNAGTDNDSSGDAVRILVPGLSDVSTTDPISGLTSGSIQEFEDFLNSKLDGQTVKVLTVPWDGWIQKTEVMATSGEMDIGFFTNQVAVPDWYADITPYLEKDDEVNMDTINDLFIEPAVYYMDYTSFTYPEATDQIFGLPMTIAGNVFVYDKQIFEDWGVEPPDENTTMPELVEMAAKMTGENPVTGKQNYGAYLTDYWFEWIAISYDAIKTYDSTDMDIKNFDKAEYVDYIKDSSEVLDFFTDYETLVASAPTGITTQTGAEKFFTEDNDIAINFDTNTTTKPIMQYIYADLTDVTDRFIPLVCPTGKSGMQGFPEFFRYSISTQAKDPDAAWDVLKQLTTNPEIVDYYIMNYQSDKMSVLKDSSGMKIAENSTYNMRHEHQSNSMFLTRDYWFWRTPLQDVNKKVVSGDLTAEEAREAFYDGVNTWVDNTTAQLG